MWSPPLRGQSAKCHHPDQRDQLAPTGWPFLHVWRLQTGVHTVQPEHNSATCQSTSGAVSNHSRERDTYNFSIVKLNNPYYVNVRAKPDSLEWTDTLPLYILTILSLRSVSILFFTSFLSLSRWCVKSSRGGCVVLGTDPESLPLPNLATFLFTSSLGVISEGLLTVSRWSVETCWSSSSSSSTQRRLATEKGEVKERLDLLSLSFRAVLRFWWRCGDNNDWTLYNLWSVLT